MIVNGAMKVLSALDWFGAPIHYPERLIDTCLARLPSRDGCHLVDAVYVLHRCSRQAAHQRAAIRDYCREVLEMIRLHRNRDGGFSYNIGRSQTGYYGVQIAKGLPESDLHGTLLLSWAIAMILEILELDTLRWQGIRP